MLSVITGIMKGFADRSALNNLGTSKYWNKGNSFLFKWELNTEGKEILQTKKLWYYLWVFTPKYAERFPYSSTALVALTDGWHLLNLLMLKAITIGVVIYPHNLIEWYISLPTIWVLMGVGFYTSYDENKL